MTENVSRKKVLLTDLGLIYSAAVWGSTFILVKQTIADVHPLLLVSYRFLIAAVVLWLFLFLKKLPRQIFSREGLVLSLIIGAVYIPQTIGLGYTQAANSGFITGLFIIFVPFFGHFFFSLKIIRRDYVAVGLGIAGLYFLTGGLKEINLGDQLTLITAAAYALHVLFTDRYIRGGCDPNSICLQQFMLTGVFSLVGALCFNLPLEVASRGAGWAILFLAIFPTLTAFAIQSYAQRYTNPVKVSLIFSLEPVFAALFAWTSGAEHPSSQSVIGGALIVCGMLAAALPEEFFHPRKAET